MEVNNEMTLKELVYQIQDYFKEVLRYWWLVCLFCLLFGGLFYYQHNKFVPTYTAEIKFLVEGQNGGGGGLNSLLGSIGIKKASKVNPYKILEVGRSTYLLEQTLLESGRNNRVIGNDLISEYNLNDKWAESDEDHVPFLFTSKSNAERNLENQKALKRLFYMIWGTKKSRKEALASLSLNDETGMYSLSMKSKNESISKDFVGKAYKGLKMFFEDEVFANQKKTADILKMKADSIRLARDGKIVELARFKDRNSNSIFRASGSRGQILEQDIFGLNQAYAEIVKSYQLTDVNLKDIQPLFMIVQQPDYPITPSRSSLVISLLKGLILGGLLAVFYIFLRKVYRDIMA